MVVFTECHQGRCLKKRCLRTELWAIVVFNLSEWGSLSLGSDDHDIQGALRRQPDGIEFRDERREQLPAPFL